MTFNPFQFFDLTRLSSKIESVSEYAWEQQNEHQRSWRGLVSRPSPDPEAIRIIRCTLETRIEDARKLAAIHARTTDSDTKEELVGLYVKTSKQMCKDYHDFVGLFGLKRDECFT